MFVTYAQGGLLLLPLVSSVDSRLQARPWAPTTSTTTGAVASAQAVWLAH